MPYVNIRITEENVDAQKVTQLIRGTTQLLVDILHKNPDNTHVVVDIIPSHLWGVAGHPVSPSNPPPDKKW